MNQHGLLSSAVILLVVHYGATLSNGAPKGTCVSMTPNAVKHGAGPQTGDSPFVVEVMNKNDSAAANESIKMVYVKSNTAATIGGILIQARVKGSEKAVGNFTEIPDGTKYLQECSDPAYGASLPTSVATHSKVLDIKMMKFQWTPYGISMKDIGNIYFVATVAENRVKYWVKLQSKMDTMTDTKTSTAMPPTNNQPSKSTKPTGGSVVNTFSFAMLTVTLGILCKW